ncbi:MAG: RdgB/HAM1 family non-canonical purine NTP pyrophosphatase [Acidobacteria bacterium]|nr:MAG: RdgB/HAM1 family non-canonical purine NTP pyrophosphatase [Acidobacteriota bacterium]REK02575.1 MAG: RdgB/HAM1 family non-canonical purine NTP pyrophosphatase [Acidobacteriota bacterium]REK13622.1 MAG: RdgB/HAM1 family non-canonical purine NTP pyrophosphatase [Acidobacteriota bacterium]REK41616.1 MAG: RdgB/HAM1 family non-canonical purine NTP pyrophosphatase [Acidobacteriota bacterium]
MYRPERLVIGTKNKGKIAELEALLAPLEIRLTGLDEFDSVPDVRETGSTFKENAGIKAREYAVFSGHWTLADDSGLVVYALDGKPGVFSARFAGNNASDLENTEKLLGEMTGLKGRDRRACFVCEMAVADDEGQVVFSALGRCEGTIADKPFGTNGFGYDPVFLPEGFDLTFGELPDEVKSRISHRAAAASEIADFFGSLSLPRT